MKFNWGTGIVISFVVFIGFILIMVYMMSTNKKYNYDLVTEEYYKKELLYQEEIDAEENISLLSKKIKIIRTDNGLLVVFPEEIKQSEIKGSVFLYRPSNKRLDFEIPLDLSESTILIPKDRLLDGRWNIIIKWKANGIEYLFKDKIRY
jgi:nitrogen fixation protein FixH